MKALPFFAAAVALSAASAHAQISAATIEPSKDNTLYLSPSGALSNGSGAGLFVGSAGGKATRAVMSFDVAAAVPAGSVVLSAELVLAITRTRSGAMTIGVHRLTQDWGEAGSVAGRGGGVGAAAQNGDATWLHAFSPNTLWNTPGGDFVATASASVSAASGSATWASTPQLVADVQDMLDNPAGNYGWLLFGQETLRAKRFGSREELQGSRPMLRIVYGNAAAVSTFGTGCSSSTGRTLQLAANGLPQLGTTWSQDTMGGGNGALSFVFFAQGVASSPIPIGNGCDLLLDPASTAFFASIGISPYGPAAVNNGVANHLIVLPSDVLLAGLDVDYQGILFDPAPTTVRSTNVLRATLGY